LCWMIKTTAASASGRPSERLSEWEAEQGC